MICDFLAEVKSLPLSSLTDDEAMEQVNKLKKEIMAAENPYIQDVLASGQHPEPMET